MESPRSSSLVASSLLPVRECQVSSKRDISLAASCVSVRLALRFAATASFHAILAGSLSGLASQATARQGNILGMLGVGSGILASLAAVGFPVETLVQFAGVSALGGLFGTVIGRRITAIELPQMVAALHSVVGLAAVLTSIASVLADVGHASTLHLVTAYLGVLIGMFVALSSLGATQRMFPRWCHVHWFHRCLLQARGKDVLQTTGSPWSPFYQRRTVGNQHRDYGRVRYHCT